MGLGMVPLDSGRNSVQFAHANASPALVWTQMWSPTIFDLIFDPIHFQTPYLPTSTPGMVGGLRPPHTPPEFLEGLRPPKPPQWRLRRVKSAKLAALRPISPPGGSGKQNAPTPQSCPTASGHAPRGPKGRRCCHVVATCCDVVATLLQHCGDVVATLLRSCCDVAVMMVV